MIKINFKTKKIVIAISLLALSAVFSSGCTKNEDNQGYMDIPVAFELSQIPDGESYYNGDLLDGSIPDGEGVLIVGNEEDEITFDGLFAEGLLIKGIVRYEMVRGSQFKIITLEGDFNKDGQVGYGTADVKVFKDATQSEEVYNMSYAGDFERGLFNGPGLLTLHQEGLTLRKENGFYENGELK